LPPELKEAFCSIGQKLPQLWEQDILTHQQKKALLRSLIDKVVAHRTVRDRVQVRIVWKGGDTTSIDLPIPVGSLAELLTDLVEMETVILDLNRQGKTDAEIAEHVTALGHRSPMKPDRVLPSTVRTIRLKHGQFQVRSQSHPRSIPGSLTVPQIARKLEIKPHWVYDRINNGHVQTTKDARTGLYLFPDTLDTLERFQKFKDGILKTLHFSQVHQDV
jgi:hypothetical protein